LLWDNIGVNYIFRIRPAMVQAKLIEGRTAQPLASGLAVGMVSHLTLKNGPLHD